MSNEYNSYEDWYDNGPGSESFKREIMQSKLEFNKNRLSPMTIPPKKIKKKKNGKALVEVLDSIEKILKADVKLTSHTMTSKGLLEEAVRQGRRLLRYVEELEK